MKFLANIIGESKAYRDISAALDNNKHALASSLSGVQKAALIYSLCHLKNERAFCAVQSENEAQTLANDLSMMGLRAMVYPLKDLSFMNLETKSYDYEHIRISILSKLVDHTCDVVIATIDAAAQYTIPKQMLKKASVRLCEGLEISMDELVRKLVLLGYEKTDNVEGTGQFALRGGIIDLFMPDADNPIRIEFFGDEIDTLNYFSVDTQRRTDYCEEIFLTPSTEILIEDNNQLADKIRKKAHRLSSESSLKAKDILMKEADMIDNNLSIGNMDKFLPLIYDTPATLFDYLDDDTLMFVSEYKNIKERNKSHEYHKKEELINLFSEGVLLKGLDTFELSFVQCMRKILSHPTVFLDTFIHGNYDTDIACSVSFNSLTPSMWNGQASILCEDLEGLDYREYATVILAGTKKNAVNTADTLIEKGYPAEFSEDPDKILHGRIYVLEGVLSSGIQFTDKKYAIITHGQINRTVKKKKHTIKHGQSISSLADLSNGEYVVHATHGIGIYQGIHKIVFNNITKDYIKIEYAGREVLYVPVTQLDMVAKYIGPSEDSKVKLNQLSNPQAWQRQKSRVKSAVKDIAKELILLYGKRMKSKGYAFSYDSEWQHDFESKFEYEETEDQLRCSKEIKDDMERVVPMDRLLCGDVGFGKTEVALRAAFKCVSDSKQCAFLCPTTILAEQHYQTVTKRFDNYPVRIDILSRFRSKKQNEETVKKLKRGEIDIIIGTHRLIQKDIEFYDLGLAIIDEEQRFGVKQKEKFKSLKENIDVLTLSATPIPRTLNMAMGGIRDMSVIEEAPDNRHPVQTFVLEYDTAVINEAIRKEIRRGGQVFYLYNNVTGITEKAYRLSEDIPEANIAIAHGKMDEGELSEIWAKMLSGELNLLVCTTIIETGVDLPNANTLIIENADKFGLSQLHQIRGRVGRSPRRAYAYFTYNPYKVLSEVAQKRLQAIREFTEFGSGFKIAMRDLELRGAGNLLGAQQHGHLGDVGYDMYLKLLNEAVKEEQGIKEEKNDVDCLIDIPINAHIPEQYIESLTNRLDTYRLIASVRTKSDKREVMDELIDRFGDIPKSVMGLIDIALIRTVASSVGIYEIRLNGDRLMLYIRDIKNKDVLDFVYKGDRTAMLNAGAKPYITLKIKDKLHPLNSLKELFNV